MCYLCSVVFKACCVLFSGVVPRVQEAPLSLLSELYSTQTKQCVYLAKQSVYVYIKLIENLVEVLAWHVEAELLKTTDELLLGYAEVSVVV